MKDGDKAGAKPTQDSVETTVDLAGAPRKRERRISEILDFLVKNATTTVEELTEKFGVSAMTIYRDIADLETDGLVNRRHGEISAAPSTLVESSSRLRGAANVEVKKRLAAAALRWIRRGNSLFLDDSTTNMHLFPQIAELAPLTVITNARFISQLVAQHTQLHLISLGGDYLNWADSYFGPLTTHAVNAMHADLCLMSSTAIHDGQCFHPDPLVAQTKRAMLRASSKNILIADHTKFKRTALHQVGPVEDFSVVITDTMTDKADIEMLESKGIEVVLV